MFSGASIVTPYAGGSLDRACHLRRDSVWLADQASSASAELIPLWRDRCLVSEGAVVRLDATAVGQLPSGVSEPVLLGLSNNIPTFAVDLSGLAEAEALSLANAERTADVRSLVSGVLDQTEAAILAYARGLCHWHRNQLFCGACGAGTRPIDGGAARECAGCRQPLFPRINPAVIMVVEAPGAPDRCLLARHAGAAEDAFALLAGFVEVGESLEDAVRRETVEEAGVVVDSVRYFASQPWPFPAGLMMGFFAGATSEVAVVDGEELLEARWFTRDELRQRRSERGRLGNPDSIDRLLLEAWLELES